MSEDLKRNRRLRLATGFTYAGLLCDALCRAFWPLFSAVLLFVGLLSFNLHGALSANGFWAISGAAGACLLFTLWIGLRRFTLPRFHHAIMVVDKTLKGRPIQGLKESQVTGQDDPIAQALWARHQAWLGAQMAEVRRVPIPIRLSRPDPFGLRFIALFVFALALLFGSYSNLRSAIQPPPAAAASIDGPQWEGWVVPPQYSRLPTLYLNDLIEREMLSLLKGSRIDLRLYGEVGTYRLSETLSARNKDTLTGSEPEQSFEIASAGLLDIEGPLGASWRVELVPDLPPEVNWDGTFDTDFYGETTFEYAAEDDFGVVSASLSLSLDLSRLERRYGLEATPRNTETLMLEAPIPLAGKRGEFTQKVVGDFSKSVWANLPVVFSIIAKDDLDQAGQSALHQVTLPGRKFFDPLAAALIEQRRDLLWSDENALRVANILRAISHRKEGVFRNEADYLQVRFIYTDLEAAVRQSTLPEKREVIAEALWELALEIEEGDVSDARERMERAQERLSQAMKNGASDEEIAELMQELRRANQDYMRQLSREAQRQQAEQGDQPQQQGEALTLTQDDIQKLMDRIQELMEQGRMAEAEQALEELRQLMENLQVTEGQQGDGQRGEGAGEDLEDLLRDQQNLSDEAFRQLQEQFENSDNSGETREGQSRNQMSGDGQRQAGPDGLGSRQQALRQQLQQQQGDIPELGEQGNEDTSRSLSDAEEAMRRAEEALREGDLSGALDDQADALSNLREGIRSLNQALAQSEADPNDADGTQQSQRQQRGEDPLGRNDGQGTSGVSQGDDVSTQDMAQRAQELLDEIRRRSGEMDRSTQEREYLKRLLDKF